MFILLVPMVNQKNHPNRTTDNPSLPTLNHQDGRQGDPVASEAKWGRGEGG